MKRASPEPAPVAPVAEPSTPKVARVECGICFEVLTAPTATSCCKQPIHPVCRQQCGPCPYCRDFKPKEWFFARFLVSVEADHSSEAYAKTVSFIANFQRHVDAVRGDPTHACFHCLTFSRAQLILSTRINRNPENRAAVQAALDRLTAVMPLAL